MRSIKWAGFCYPDSEMRPLVHFFPSAGSVGAPYPVACKLTVFGQGGSEERSMVIEGARLSQPDGISLVDAFENFTGGKSSNTTDPVGLEIELSLFQPGVNIDKSVAIVEFSGRSGIGIRFRPERMDQSEAAEQSGDAGGADRALLIKDSFLRTSLILVNPGAEKMEFSGTVLPGGSSVVEAIPARSVKELRFEDSIFNAANPVSCSFGLTRGVSLDASKPGNGELLMYALYRDAQNDDVISVSAL